MPRTSDTRSKVLAIVAAGLAFAATLAVLLLGGTAEEPAPRGLDGPRGMSTEARITRLSLAVRARPRDADAYTALGAAHLQSARESGDPGAYDRAGSALRRALAIRPGDAAALTERGALRLARHDFRGALDDALAARAAAPDVNKPFGVLVDALVELGRYPAAERALQQMVDRKPNVDAYARVAYLRELRGDLAGAADALRLAISAGGAVPENTAYVQALLGDLELVRGRTDAATRAYRGALRLVPDHPPSEYGLARADVARGRLDAAIRRLRGLVDRLPAPAYVTALGEAELAAGRRAAARRDLALVRAQVALLTAAGVDSDAELAIFEADHGSPRRAVRLAERAWRSAPSVRSADARGWTLTRAGRPREGLAWARRALRLGSKDPGFRYHAAVAAAQSGAPSEARRLLAATPLTALGPLAARDARSIAR